jgi:hypothetical protein
MAMNIQTVATNLRVTIAGKEELLADLKGRRIPPEVSIHYLEINIDELKRILEDVEQCIPKEPEFDESDSEEVRNLIRMGR